MQRTITTLLALTFATACAATAEDPDATPDEEIDCATVALSDCEAEPACGLQRAQRLSEDGSCYGPTTEPIACDVDDAVAGGAETVRLAPDGTCWFSGSNYLPSGWTDDEAEIEAACPPTETPTCAE